ncbi:MAG TPA: cytochrome c biogenesis protein ResB, partial [Flavobacteriales bacterium]|nr:cytochrome c biogenesis protein ResB [Flavobacteriales bacterium]
MKRALLRTALRKEVVGLARVTVIILTIFLLLLEFGYRSDISMNQRMEQLSFGLVGAAAFVMLGSLLRNSLRGFRLRKAEVLWFITALFLLIGRPFGLTPWAQDASWPYLVFLALFVFIELSRLEIGRNTRLFNPALLFVASFVLIIMIGTALFLLLLLAIAAIPGSLVPQVSSDPNGVIQYKAENPDLAPVLDAFGIFNTYTSV